MKGLKTSWTAVADILKVDFLALSQLVFQNICAGKLAKKNSKLAYKVGKLDKIFQNKRNNEFASLHFKIPNFVQSQLNVAPSHDCETVTFRNPGLWQFSFNLGFICFRTCFLNISLSSTSLLY